MASVLSHSAPRPLRKHSSPRFRRLDVGSWPAADRAIRDDLSIAPPSFGSGFVLEGTDCAPYGNFLHRARTIDRELSHLARDDGAARLVLGRLLNRFVQMGGWEHFGFSRLGDYGAERLGWSGRQLDQLALVARRLAELPEIESALRMGRLGWSKTRLLSSIATASDETGWLAVAANTNVRTLAAVTAHARAAIREQHQLPGMSFPASMPGRREKEEDEDSETQVRVRIPCTRRAARLWGQIRRHAPRVAGRSLSAWEIAQLAAAEASSAETPFRHIWQREPWHTLASPRLDGGHCSASRSAGKHHPAEIAEDQRPAFSFEKELERLEELDVHELDAAMRRVRRAMQQRQFRLGVALGEFLDLRLQAELGYASASEYVCERLGMAERTARELIRVARAVQDAPPLLARAYADGELSWLRVLALLPVARANNAAAWIERAHRVTLRRLTDEVDWGLSRIDRDSAHTAPMPPNSDVPLVDDDERQMCANASPEDDLWGVTGRIHVTFVAPLSVSIRFRSVLQGFAAPTEPRWKALERMLEHALARFSAGEPSFLYLRGEHQART